MPIQIKSRRLGLTRLGRCAAALLAAAFVTAAMPPVSIADDVVSLARNLSSASDFRVRVGAALSLGKTRNTLSVKALSAALDDPHPAVRAAAAAGLGALGRTDALDELRAHLAGETAPSVQSQLRAAVEKLAALEQERSARTSVPRRAKPAKVLVKLGQLMNMSAARGPRVAEVFRGATRVRAGELPGVEVLGEGIEGAAEALIRKLPVLVLDGVINRLTQGQGSERLTISAQVEFTFRKIPEHALRGTVTGAAQALGGDRSPRDGENVAELESQALCGAVESAMRGAPEVMLAALR
jgi:hypothetical protein